MAKNVAAGQSVRLTIANAAIAVALGLFLWGMTISGIQYAHAASDPLRKREQCLGEICLGDSVQKLKAVPWSELESVPKTQQSRFPLERFSALSALHGDFPTFRPIPLVGIVLPVNIAPSIIDLRGSQLVKLANIWDLAFCEPTNFAAYFRSKSGHATTVGFSPVAVSSNQHDLVVEYIGRRFVLQEEAVAEFKATLRRDYPSLVDTDDLRLKCHGPLGICDFPEHGKSESPTRDTAVEAARSRGVDYIVYFRTAFGATSPSRDLELQIFSAMASRTLPAMNRFGSIALSEHPSCAKPKSVVPSVE